MGVSSGQRDDIRNFLLGRGLAFKPLLDEMSDHIACDLENLMAGGLTYEEAWKKTMEDLPEDHFKQIQKETMDTINHRFILSRVFTFIGMATLLFAATFKILHLSGADQLILTSFGALALSLLSGSVAGIYFNRDKDGAASVLSIVVGTILLQIGYSFKILHIPGADQIIGLSVATLLAGMLINTFFVYNKASGYGNLFTFLHEKYTPGIERFLLIMIGMVVVTRAVEVGLVMINLVVIVAAGLHFIALLWGKMEKGPARNNILTLILVILTFTCYTVPMLGVLLAYEVRLVMVTWVSLLGALLVFRLEPSKTSSSYLVCVAPIMFLLLALVKFGWMTSFSSNIVLNAAVVAVMIACILLSPKASLARTFMIMSLAGYLLEQ